MRFLPKHSSREFNHTLKVVGKEAKPVVKTVAHDASKVANAGAKAIQKGLKGVGGFLPSTGMLLLGGAAVVAILVLRR